jgi:hypothetical protein
MSNVCGCTDAAVLNSTAHATTTGTKQRHRAILMWGLSGKRMIFRSGHHTLSCCDYV